MEMATGRSRRFIAPQLLVALIGLSTNILRALAADQTPTCISGYTFMNPMCYKYVTTSSSWDYHRTNCISTGGWLVTIRSAAENANVDTAISATAWIGLNDNSVEGTYVWTHGDTDLYRFWGSGEPTGDDENCIYLSNNDGHWGDTECSNYAPGVCESNPVCANGYVYVYSAGVCRELLPSSQPSSQPSRQPSSQPTGQPSIQPSRQPSMQPSRQPSGQPSRQPSGQPTGQPSGQPTTDRIPICPSGYTWMNPMCYMLLTATADWDTQRSNCISSGGWLATIRSAAENANLNSVISGNTWIGLNDIAVEATYVWTHGETDSYRNYYPGQPNGGAAESCFYMMSNDGRWKDNVCTVAFSGACEASFTCPNGYVFVSSAGVCRVPQPSSQPSSQPSCQPTVQPTTQPSIQPSHQPSVQPSCQPSSQPSEQPTGQPSGQPTTDRIATCPAGYTFINPMCYTLISATPDWDTQRVSCIASGGWLATIRSVAENTNVKSIITINTWIGLNDISVEGSFVWTHGDVDTYRNWAPNEPTGGTSYNCTFMYNADARWSDSSCVSTRPAACESNPTCPSGYGFVSSAGVCRELQPSSQPSVQPSCQPSDQPTRQPSMQPSRQPSGQPSRQPSGQPTGQPSGQPTTDRIPICPSGYTWMNPMCYKFLSTTAAWDTQRTSCISSGGWLATIRSATENAIVDSSLGNEQFVGIWIGLNDISAEGTFVWTHGETDSYRNWAPNQPTGSTASTDCVLLYYDGLWYDDLCSYAYYGACESSPICPSGYFFVSSDGVCRSTPTSQPSSQPSYQPTIQPTMQPTTPSSQPSRQPSTQPSRQPSTHPSRQPSRQPSMQPSRQPSCQPSRQPSGQPTGQPSGQPTTDRIPICPSGYTWMNPMCYMLLCPSGAWDTQRTSCISSGGWLATIRSATEDSNVKSLIDEVHSWIGLNDISVEGIFVWTHGDADSYQNWYPGLPAGGSLSNCIYMLSSDGRWADMPCADALCGACESYPTCPSGYIFVPSAGVCRVPSPSSQPSSQPSRQPTNQPTKQPAAPSAQPSVQPSRQPSMQPTSQPSQLPTGRPSRQPSNQPSMQPSRQPYAVPSSQPSSQPSSIPTVQPSLQPLAHPSAQPTVQPSGQPSNQPSVSPSVQPSQRPSVQPTGMPSSQPTSQPSILPTGQPSQQPSGQPTGEPSAQLSSLPSTQPSGLPSGQPSYQPSQQPSLQPSAQPTAQPSIQPSTQPISQPSMQPSDQPSSQPSSHPTGQPSSQPSLQPSGQPSAQPLSLPSLQPSVQPTGFPSSQPTCQPSGQLSVAPSVQPSTQPSCQPTHKPSSQPSGQPSSLPSRQPSTQPSCQPSMQPSGHPSMQPTVRPTDQPTGFPSSQPSGLPSLRPSSQPSGQPSVQPSCRPSGQPSCQPSGSPSSLPSRQPSSQPSRQPSKQPSVQPSTFPTGQPSIQPSGQPSCRPSGQPSTQPSSQPSRQPSGAPTSQPSLSPSSPPSMQPSSQPSLQPTTNPTDQPTGFPSSQPTCQPSSSPSGQPSVQPMIEPSAQPTGQPSMQSSGQPSGSPSVQPCAQPSHQPSGQPSAQSSCAPSGQPSNQPSGTPSGLPSRQPSRQPSIQPSVQPSMLPTGQPSAQPSRQPSSCLPSGQPRTLSASWQPSSRPSLQPSTQPSALPSGQPSEVPSPQPSLAPSSQPSGQPSGLPSIQPSYQPSCAPSEQPTGQPSAQPSCQSSSQPSRQPSSLPSVRPSLRPSSQPSRQPVALPSTQPTARPSAGPTNQPIVQPTTQPTQQPYALPSAGPTRQPSSYPSAQPSIQPTSRPCSTPTAQPSTQPSVRPSHQSSEKPSSQPTCTPSQSPSARKLPTSVPSHCPSSQPSSRPSAETVTVVFVTSGVLASDGLQVAVNLNVATNRAGYGNQRFACDKLLSFAAAASYICSWGNASQLIIQDTTRADFFIDSAVALASGSGLLVLWSASMGIPRPRTVLDVSSFRIVLAPASPDLPVIGSFAPSVISRCSNWQLDLSSATVAGNAGRAWKNMSFAVQGDLLHSNTTLITAELYRQSALSALIVVPNALLIAGEQYTVQVRLCNAMGGCAAKSMTTAVSSSNEEAPVVSILGSAAITMRPKDAVVLTSNAYTLLCNGQRSTGTLQYTWKIRLSSNSSWISGLLSVSKDKSKYSLPPQSLRPSQSYLIMLSVRDSSSNLSASAVTSIAVMPSNLIVTITPAASTLVFRASSILVLNASASYDPDMRSTALDFKWSCASGVASSCLLFLNASARSTVTISADQAAINSTSTIHLLVSDAATKQRNSTAVVQVQVIEPTKPLISLLPSAVNVSYLNLDQALSLQSTVLSPLSCNASWQAYPKDKVLMTAGNVLAFKVVPGNRLTNVNLYLPAFSLLGGLSYTFIISCSSSSVSIAVTTNNPPQGGVLSAQPTAGFALNTSFLLTTELWNDADLPLAFTFAFWSSVDSSYLSIRRKSVVASASAILPSGGAGQEMVNVTVIAEDSYNASSGRRYRALKVSPLPSLQAVAFVSNLLTMQNISADELQNVLSVATTVLNQVPCSSAPNCTSLHRTGCKATANTCGACVVGFVTTGKAGDDNSPCLSLSAVSAYNVTKSTRTCSSSSAGSVCASWQYCNTTTGTCKDQSKQCSSPACASNGRCAFQSSSTGMVMSACPLTSASCDALCYCNFGYAGEDCSLTTAEIASQQALRSQLMNSLTSVMSRTDSDASSLANAATSLYAIIRNQYDITALLASQVAGFIMDILNQAAPLTEQVALKIASVLAPVNAALQSISSSNSSSSATSQAGNLSVALDAFQQLLDKEKQPFDVVYDSFRLTSQSVDTSQPATGSAPTSYKVSIPLTEAEKAAQSLGQASTLPSVSILLTQGNSSTDSVFVSVVVLDQQQWKSNATSLVSDIVSVRASNVDFVDITLHSSNTGPQAEAVNYTISCSPRIRVTKNFTCADSGYTEYLQCNGTAGSFFGFCPVLLATCSALNTASQGIATSGSQCSAINSTSTGITCRCEISSGGVVAAGLVMRYVGSDFSSPFKSAASFNNAAAVGKAYIIVVLYGALWGCAAVMMVYCGWYLAGAMGKKKAADGRTNSDSKGSHSSAVASHSADTRDNGVDCLDGGESGEGAALKKARQQLAAYISAIFPAAFAPKPVMAKVKHEFMDHHLYANFFFRLTQSASPVLSLVIMITMQSFLLWLLALLYDLNYPSDDGSCVYFITESACLNRKYVLDSQHSYCQWRMEDASCLFSNPSFSLTTGLYISVMISVATCLVLVPLEYLMSLLRAPTIGSSAADNRPAPAITAIFPSAAVKVAPDIEARVVERSTSNITAASPRRSSSIRRHLPLVAMTVHENTAHDLAGEFQPVLLHRQQRKLSLHSMKRVHNFNESSLFEEIVLQRSLLEADQRAEFDAQWGLDSSTGAFLTKEHKDFCFRKHTVSMESMIQQEQLDTKAEASSILEELSTASDAERGFEILQAFVKDLLGRRTPSGRIFATKAELDCEKEPAVAWSVQVAVAVFIFLLNGFFIYYTILKGYDKGLAWQFDYVKAWLVQLVLDVFVFETVQCAWIHVIVPSLVSQEVCGANDLLQHTMESVYDGSYEEQHGSSAVICLNAPEHLFVSHRLADAYPELLESKMVKAYANHLPGALGKVWQSKLKNQDDTHSGSVFWLFSKTFLLSLLIQLAAYAPVYVQSIFIRVLEPVLLAALTFAFVLFLHKPVYLCIVGAAVLLVGANFARDYYRARVPEGVQPAPVEMAVAVANPGDAPPEAIMEDTPAAVEVTRASSVASVSSEDDDLLFHRLFPNADADDDEKSDASSDASSSIADSDLAGLFSGSESDASSAASFIAHVVDNDYSV